MKGFMNEMGKETQEAAQTAFISLLFRSSRDFDLYSRLRAIVVDLVYLPGATGVSKAPQKLTLSKPVQSVYVMVLAGVFKPLMAVGTVAERESESKTPQSERTFHEATTVILLFVKEILSIPCLIRRLTTFGVLSFAKLITQEKMWQRILFHSLVASLKLEGGVEQSYTDFSLNNGKGKGEADGSGDNKNGEDEDWSSSSDDDSYDDYEEKKEAAPQGKHGLAGLFKKRRAIKKSKGALWAPALEDARSGIHPQPLWLLTNLVEFGLRIHSEDEERFRVGLPSFFESVGMISMKIDPMYFKQEYVCHPLLNQQLALLSSEAVLLSTISSLHTIEDDSEQTQATVRQCCDILCTGGLHLHQSASNRLTTQLVFKHNILPPLQNYLDLRLSSDDITIITLAKGPDRNVLTLYLSCLSHLLFIQTADDFHSGKTVPLQSMVRI